LPLACIKIAWTKKLESLHVHQLVLIPVLYKNYIRQLINLGSFDDAILLLFSSCWMPGIYYSYRQTFWEYEYINVCKVRTKNFIIVSILSYAVNQYFDMLVKPCFMKQ
jgi:hypothetical protein